MHVHPKGSHCLILALNSVIDLDALISSGTNAQVLGPLKDNVSVPTGVHVATLKRIFIS